jgi:hypothetical protein
MKGRDAPFLSCISRTLLLLSRHVCVWLTLSYQFLSSSYVLRSYQQQNGSPRCPWSSRYTIYFEYCRSRSSRARQETSARMLMRERPKGTTNNGQISNSNKDLPSIFRVTTCAHDWKRNRINSPHHVSLPTYGWMWWTLAFHS